MEQSEKVPVYRLAVPTLPSAAVLAEAGYATGAAIRNWQAAAPRHHARNVPDWGRGMLCDPQTSGGLLVSVRADRADDVVRRCIAAVVKEMAAGEVRATVI